MRISGPMAARRPSIANRPLIFSANGVRKTTFSSDFFLTLVLRVGGSVSMAMRTGARARTYDDGREHSEVDDVGWRMRGVAPAKARDDMVMALWFDRGMVL